MILKCGLPPSGINFINIMPSALAPLDLCQSYWCTAQSVHCKIWSYFIVVSTSKVGCNFLVKLNCSKEGLLAHLHFAQLAWWNGPQNPRTRFFLDHFHFYIQSFNYLNSRAANLFNMFFWNYLKIMWNFEASK